MNKTIKNQKLLTSVVTAMLIAIIILLTLTKLGYITLAPGFSLCIISLPVAIGAIFFGPWIGLILGLAFGLSSLFAGISGLDPVGPLLFGISPIGLIVMCIIPRILMGFLTGVIYKSLCKKENAKILPYFVASFAAPILNTILYLTTFWIFYHNFDEATNLFGSNNLFIIIFVVSGLNALIETLVCGTLGTTITKALSASLRRMH